MSDTVTCCAPVHSSVLRSSPCSQEPPDHQELARHHHDTDRHQVHLNITRPRQRMLFVGTVGDSQSKFFVKAKNAMPNGRYSCFPNPAQPSFRDISRTVTSELPDKSPLTCRPMRGQLCTVSTNKDILKFTYHTYIHTYISTC